MTEPVVSAVVVCTEERAALVEELKAQYNEWGSCGNPSPPDIEAREAI